MENTIEANKTSYRDDVVIRVSHLEKIYRLYNKPTDRIKDALSLRKESKFPENHALKDVSFEIKRGETVGIIGTNGSGKSTVLKIITGVLSPNEGDVFVDGRISALLELGAGFNPEYTGIENVYLNGTMMGFTKEEIDEKLDAILEFADIGDFVYQPVKMYSSGMFVRLAFAVAINIEPEILIVDEALSVGDMFFQMRCYQKFEEFKAAGRTILFVTHDMNSIKKYCDRVILLNKGVKVDEGDPSAMVDLYKKVMVKSQAGEVVKRNPDCVEEVSGLAEIKGFELYDAAGNVTNVLEKGSEFKLKMDISFNEDIKNPCCSFSLHTIKGIEVCGGKGCLSDGSYIAKGGKKLSVTFTQNMDLQGDEYMLSLYLEGEKADSDGGGEKIMLHKLYDLTNITVISDKNTVGFYDTNSDVVVTKIIAS